MREHLAGRAMHPSLARFKCERERGRERETVTVRESPSFLSCLLSFLGIVTDNGGEGRALVPFQKTVLKREREAVAMDADYELATAAPR